MKPIKIDIPIYYGYLNVIIANNESEMIEVGKQYNHKEDISKFGAFTWSSYDDENIFNCYVCMQRDCSMHLLAHEVVHLVNAIFIHIGCQLDRHNDEPQAYLTGWVFKQVLDMLSA